MRNMLRSPYASAGRLLRLGAMRGSFTPLSLFASGEQGAWYDPSDFSTMFQDSAGTTPVTAVEQPVGLILDKSKNAIGSNGNKCVNLLTYSEDFSNAAWAKTFVTSTVPSVSTNQGTAPDGTMTADLVTFGVIDASGDVSIIRQLSGLQTNTEQTGTVYLKAASAGEVGKRVYVYLNDSIAIRAYTAVVLTTEWQRVSVTGTYATANRFFSIATSGSGSFDGLGSNADSNAAVLVWGADLRLSSEVSTSPSYQKIGADWPSTFAGNHASQTTSTSRPVLKQDANGKYYLLFDGTDDFLVTGTINPGSVDKAQVFAGVRKLSDALDGRVVQHGDPSSLDNGSFVIEAPGSGAVTKYQFASRGTLTAVPFTTSTAFNAPNTSVVTGLSDIAGDTATLRANGTQIAQVTTDQGTGNYLSYPLYIGSRLGSLRFNGNLYGLIVRFSAANLSSETITKAETWMNTKTGAY